MKFFAWCQTKLGFRPTTPRELRCVPWLEGDKIIRLNQGWRIAPEEDRNRCLGMVYLERDVPTQGTKP